MNSFNSNNNPSGAFKASIVSNVSIASTASKASKALIITYYWPPSGGAGVQRWLKFSKYLPEFGWEPIILTVNPEFAAYPVTDFSLIEDIPAGIKVHKTAATDYFSIYKKDKTKIPSAGFAISVNNTLKGKILRFIRGNFFIPDPRKGWNKYAFKKACEIIENEEIKHVITTSPPHSTQLIGLSLKKRFPGINWVADLRDPWTDIYYYKQFYPTIISKLIDSRYERRVLLNADRIITVGESLKKSFSSKVHGIESKTEVITNGYDENDFNSHNESKPERLTITYVGTLSDIYPVTGFLSALRNFKSVEKDFLLRFVGFVAEKVKEEIISAIPETSLEFISYVKHNEAIKHMISSSALLLIIPSHQSNRSIITGKLFEYLATGKPVLCLGPVDGDAADIIKKCKSGITADYNDSENISEFLVNLSQFSGSADKKAVGEYSRFSLTGKVAGILESGKNAWKA
jgi:glycosyltransferase involved in cell wall biosynthesis